MGVFFFLYYFSSGSFSFATVTVRRSSRTQRQTQTRTEQIGLRFSAAHILYYVLTFVYIIKNILIAFFFFSTIIVFSELCTRRSGRVYRRRLGRIERSLQLPVVRTQHIIYIYTRRFTVFLCPLMTNFFFFLFIIYLFV